MSWETFLLLMITCAITILLCRVVPIFVLRGKELSKGTQDVLNLIPPAAFAALVANDLLSPTMFDGGLVSGLIPLIAAVVVAAVALKTKNLLACAVVGVAVYALLLFLQQIGCM